MDAWAELITALTGLVVAIGGAGAAIITALRRVSPRESRQSAERALDESDEESS